jgi:geranylgeranylglycerol-phosphate geranylgeranyltransferase
MMGIAVIIGEVAIAGRIPSITQMVLGFLVSFSLTASAMVVNDIVDLEIDRINAPTRPLPSGRISRNQALVFGGVLALLGVASALALSPLLFAIAVVTFLVSLTYNLYGKKLGLPGNIMVGFTIAVPFLFGGITVSGTINFDIASFFSLAFLATVGREITKGIADVIGDKVKGIKTIAIVHGSRVAAVSAAAFYLAAVSISPIPFLYGNLGIYYLLIVLIVDAGFIFSSAQIIRNHNRDAALRVKGQARLWMLLALLAFFVGGLTH